jgi:hypothetical protein
MMVWQKLMSAPAAGGFSCTITIGDYFGAIYGYNPSLAIGSIDAEPIPGETLFGCYWIPGDNLYVAFETDIVSTVTSLDVWLGGVNYGGSGAWTYGDLDGDMVTHVIRGTMPSATSGTILLELK